MKKILFATTALVATAGVAAADVNFSGYGRFGALYLESTGNTSITSRYRLTIDGSAESDGGLTFGARVRIQQNDGTATNTGINKARFSVSTGGLTVAVGNIYGAMDSMAGLYAGSVGLTGLGWGNVVTGFAAHGYSSGGAGNAPDGVEVIYSADAFTVHLSHATNRTEIAAKFSFGDWTIGAAVADGGAAATDWVLTAGGKIGSVKLGLAIAEVVAGTNATISAGFSVGSATSINVYVADFAGTSNYGLGVVHSLGGGTSIQGGIASLGGVMRADLGLKFNF